jgi:hypothetical protein
VLSFWRMQFDSLTNKHLAKDSEPFFNRKFVIFVA